MGVLATIGTGLLGLAVIVAVLMLIIFIAEHSVMLTDLTIMLIIFGLLVIGAPFACYRLGAALLGATP